MPALQRWCVDAACSIVVHLQSEALMQVLAYAPPTALAMHGQCLPARQRADTKHPSGSCLLPGGS